MINKEQRTKKDKKKDKGRRAQGAGCCIFSLVLVVFCLRLWSVFAC
jgi:hypothetical protein